MALRVEEGVAAGLIMTAAVEAVKAVHDLMPPIPLVRKATPGSETAADIRCGQLAAGATALAIGGAAALVTGSWRPLLASVVAAAALVVFYQWLLHRQSDEAAPSRPVSVYGRG